MCKATYVFLNSMQLDNQLAVLNAYICIYYLASYVATYTNNCLGNWRIFLEDLKHYLPKFINQVTYINFLLFSVICVYMDW